MCQCSDETCLQFTVLRTLLTNLYFLFRGGGAFLQVWLVFILFLLCVNAVITNLITVLRTLLTNLHFFFFFGGGGLPVSMVLVDFF
jgi:hypothetical protein